MYIICMHICEFARIRENFTGNSLVYIYTVYPVTRPIPRVYWVDGCAVRPNPSLISLFLSLSLPPSLPSPSFVRCPDFCLGSCDVTNIIDIYETVHSPPHIIHDGSPPYSVPYRTWHHRSRDWWDHVTVTKCARVELTLLLRLDHLVQERVL